MAILCKTCFLVSIFGILQDTQTASEIWKGNYISLCFHELFVVMILFFFRLANSVPTAIRTFHSKSNKALRAAPRWWWINQLVCEVQWVESRPWNSNGKQFDQIKHQGSTGNPATWPTNWILSFCRGSEARQERTHCDQSVALHIT